MQKYWIHFHCGTFTLWLFDSHGSERIRQHYEIYYIVEWIPRQGDARKYTIYACGASIFNSWLLGGNIRLNSRLLIFYFCFALHFFTNLFHFSCFFSRVFAIFTREWFFSLFILLLYLDHDIHQCVCMRLKCFQFFTPTQWIYNLPVQCGALSIYTYYIQST